MAEQKDKTWIYALAGVWFCCVMCGLIYLVVAKLQILWPFAANSENVDEEDEDEDEEDSEEEESGSSTASGTNTGGSAATGSTGSTGTGTIAADPTKLTRTSLPERYVTLQNKDNHCLSFTTGQSWWTCGVEGYPGFDGSWSLKDSGIAAPTGSAYKNYVTLHNKAHGTCLQYDVPNTRLQACAVARTADKSLFALIPLAYDAPATSAYPKYVALRNKSTGKSLCLNGGALADYPSPQPGESPGFNGAWSINPTAYVTKATVDDPCSSEHAAPVATACLNDVWKKAGCTTTIPSTYTGWWKNQPLDVIRRDMAAYGAMTDTNSAGYKNCRTQFTG